MRLINVHTFELREFNRANVPHYAILSHGWEDEEVTFQDILSGRGRDMIGWKKIEGCCRIASQDKLDWAWVDPAASTKAAARNSPKLSTACSPGIAIQSFAIRICLMSYGAGKRYNLENGLGHLEPASGSREWQEIGTKESLGEEISHVTGVQHLYNYQDASVGQKMSWTSQRETTRIEDQAYCLLGIFGINMPPLYGEGEGAFLRLQLEILKISNDESLFAWSNESMPQGGLLARSPRSFQYAGDIISVDFPRLARPPYMMTNKGIEIWVRLEGTDTEAEEEKFKMFFDGHYRSTALNCARAGNTTIPLSIVLRRDPGSAVYNRSIDMKFCGPSSSLYKGPFSKPFPSPPAVGGIFEKKWIHHSSPLSSSVRTWTYFRIQISGLPTPGWVVGRFILNHELGCWGVDTPDGVDLKLCGTYAGLALQRTDARARSAHLIVLKFGNHSKKGPISGGFFELHTFRNGSLDIDILNGLRSPLKSSDIIITHELRAMAISVSSGKYLKASFQREGGAGCHREIITIRLEEVKELSSTDRIY